MEEEKMSFLGPKILQLDFSLSWLGSYSQGRRDHVSLRRSKPGCIGYIPETHPAASSCGSASLPNPNRHHMSMSTSSPEDEDCVVAVKFLGPQLSFCRPATQSEWTNVRIENMCFYSSRVMFSKKDDVFRTPGSGGHLIGSWDPCKPSDNPKLQILRFQNLPKLLTSTHELMDSCSMTEHLVESRTTGETFLVKQYMKSFEIIDGVAEMETKFVLALKLDEEGNAVYTHDIGDLVIFLSKSEPLCVPASSFPDLDPNYAYILDCDELSIVDLSVIEHGDYIGTFPAPYYIPPQNINY